ncbi:uncharacterized protein C2orf42 homolog [Anopheles bellator]|uniref:uncharacterized protein C2orf42 homolog n=1 Tax=Anopheles bellator TaxID=139047 RepID=UPI002647B634|nr:uncharacterized protein C2orf42 homolog [Anopheles bellator]
MSVKVVNRSSFRGIRKCPKCGLFNGNRAEHCKNSSCLSILQSGSKNRAEKNTPDGSSFAVHLHQSPLYSVTHSNGLRSFIEHSSNEPDGKMLLRTVAGNSVKDANSVIQLILNCKSEAEPMPIKDAVIETLAVSEMDKNSLGKQQFPLVQRLFQDLYVVGQPDGVWQHVKAVRRKQIYTELQCSCHSERVAMNCWHKLATIAAMLSARHCYGARWAKLLQSFVKKESSPTPNPVLSYGTFPLSDCNIAAKCLTIGGSNVEYIDLGGSKLQSTEVIQQALFNDNDDQRFDLSDSLKIDVLSNGYELMIDDGTTATMASPISEVPDVFATAAIDDLQLMNCQIELMDEFDLTDRIDFCPSDVELIETEKLLLPTNGDENLSNASPDIEPLVEISTKKGAFLKGLTNEKLTKGSYSLRKLMRVLESNGIVFHRSARSAPSFEASVCNLSFVGWLEAVIEQLNSVIDYNRDGRPEQQIFRIHEDFFHCLRSRFSIGHGKRQPDSVDDEVVNSQHRALQTQHYKFSHHNSLQNVFRTDRMKLAFEKNFSRSTRGQFTAVDKEKAENPSPSNGRPIHPEYYSTFIKLGRYQHELNPHKVYSLSIAWTAGVLPRSGFGELRINFEYGHRMNGRYVAPPLS